MPEKPKRNPAAFNLPANNNAGPAGNNSTSAPAGKSPQNTLIIGIDFGTTFTGVAWHNIASNKTHLITTWPNQNQHSSKIPTVLQYSSKGIKWGNVPATPANKRLEWFKLLLNEDNYTTLAELLHRLKTKGLKGYPGHKFANLAKLETTIKAIPEGKKPADLAADYLRSLYEYIQFNIGQDFPTLNGQLWNDGGVEIKCCLTVPDSWDDKGKEAMKQAAIDAGLLENQIYMISELEAAAVHCLTDLCEAKGNLKVGEVYVIVDCGDETMDLISYEVTSTSPLRVSECTIGTGGLCASTALDRRFENLVISRIGKNAYDKMEDVDRRVMRNDFELEIKYKFHPNHDYDDELEDYDCVICALPGVPDDPKTRVKRGRILFSNNELKQIFEHTFAEIMELVQKEVDIAQEATKKNVDCIFLVGKFGSSQYLANWVKSSLQNLDRKEINLIMPLDPALTITLGAVTHGVHTHWASKSSKWGIVEIRRARYNYGISIPEPFQFGVHPLSKLVMTPSLGVPMCIDRMKWLIRKGEPMHEHVGISFEFPCICPVVKDEEVQKTLLVFEQKFYCCAEDTSPAGLEHPSVYPFLTYKIDFSDPQFRRCFTKQRSANSSREYWLIRATILLKLGAAGLIFTTLVGGKVVGQGTKAYHHQEPRVEPLWAPTHGRVPELGNAGQDNQDEYEIESGLGSLALGG